MRRATAYHITNLHNRGVPTRTTREDEGPGPALPPFNGRARLLDLLDEARRRITPLVDDFNKDEVFHLLGEVALLLHRVEVSEEGLRQRHAEQQRNLEAATKGETR